METRQILIKILTQLQKGGIEAAQTAMQGVSKATRNTSNDIREHNRIVGTLRSAWNRVGGASGVFRAGLNRVRASVKSLGSVVRSAATGFGFFRSVYGRVIQGLITVAVFQGAIRGFQALTNAVVEGNSRMQTAIGTFTALSGGSRQMATTFIDVLKQLSVSTGAAFDELLDGAKRLPSRVGQNVKAFEDLTKAAIVLSRIDPVQGLQGAFFALTNAMEGTAAGARSLIQRFEIGTTREFRAAIEETGNTVDAITLLLQRSGIEVDSFLKATENTFPVVTQGLKAIASEFVRLSTEKVFGIITEDLAQMRDWLRDNQAAIQGLALAIGDRLVGALAMFKAFLKDIILGGKELTAGNIFDALLEGAVSLVEFLANALSQFLNFVAGLASAIANVLNAIFGFFGGSTNAPGAISDIGQAADKSTASTVAFKESIEDTTDAVKDLSDASRALDRAGLRISPEQALSQLGALRDKGKETLKLMVNDILDAVTSTDLEQIGAAILNNIIDLEAQEIAQEKSIDNIEKWVDAAKREVDAAKDKLKLFDLATADIPERFTRARRRQLELEILRAEQEQDRRRDALDAAKEQLAVTKEQLKFQREILSLIEKRQEESGGGGLDTGPVAGTIDTEAFKAQAEEFRKLFAEKLEPASERLKTAFGEVGDSIREAIDSAKELATSFGNVWTMVEEGWNNLPEGVRTLLVGGAIAGAAILGIDLLFKVASTLLPFGSAIVKWLVGGAAGAISLPALALVGATLVLGAEIWFGRAELSKWVSGERQLELGVVILAKANELLNKLLGTVGIEGVDLTSPVVESLEETKTAIDQAGLAGHIAESVAGLPVALGSALAPAAESFIGWGQGIFDELIGNSIFPDMMTEIINLMTEMPGRLAGPLQSFREGILGEMAMIRDEWIRDWVMMAQIAQQSLEFLNLARETALNMGSALAGLGLNQTINNFGQQGPKQLDLKLDANATQEFFEKGTFSAFLDLFG